MKNFVAVEVVERVVLGVTGYFCRCRSCGWTSRGFEKEKRAADSARAHGAICIGKPPKKG